jgi:NADH-quinone oxidoreductase subunit D
MSERDINLDPFDIEDGESGESRTMFLNIGPSHPAMHGIIRIITELDGEIVRKAEIEIGYLHRCFEKSAEHVSWNGVMPYTDRLNYVSPFINNFGYCMAVEKLLGIRPPERAEYIRTLLAEISRLTDHLTCVGASAMELGAMTAFLYFMQAREVLYELKEEVAGARITLSFGRVGGVRADLPENFAENCRSVLKKVRKLLGECDSLLTKNRIFYDRVRGTGVISREDALSYGIMGPFLRGTGVAHDLRKAEPYHMYERMEFDVPTGERGDNYDRYLVRMEEMRQSMRIVEQCLRQIEPGEIRTEIPPEFLDASEAVDTAKHGRTEGLIDREVQLSPNLGGQDIRRKAGVITGDKRVALPSLGRTYSNIESLMNHFMLVMDYYGLRPPPGEAYAAVEGANGELGFYVVSDGSGFPYRVRVHPPCFPILSSLEQLLVGGMVADIIATFGSVNMIGGELDR